MRVWIIGADSEYGIGRAVCSRMTKEMGKYEQIYISGRLETDVTDPAALERTYKRYDHIDAVVYCAGIAQLEWIRNLTSEAVKEVLDVNLIGFINVLSLMTKHQDYGRMIAIVSDASVSPMRGSMSYCVSKAALRMAIKCAARELAPKWQVMGVSPCVVEGTPMTAWIDEAVAEFRGWTLAEARKYEHASLPMARRCNKDEVAKVVCDLVSGPAYLNGSIIDITGGK